MAKNLFFLIFISQNILIFSLRNGTKISDLPPKNMFSTQDRLISDVFKNYDKRVSSILNSNKFRQTYFIPGSNHTLDGWILWITIDQMKVIDLDEPQELFTTSVNILLEWNDVRLIWKSRDYDGIHSIFVRQEMVWTPPLSFFSASDVKDHRDLDYRIVEVMYYGLISEYITLRLTTNCGLNMIDFPFDIQNCEIHLGISSVDFNIYNISIDLPESSDENLCNMRNSAWDIVNVSTGSLKMKPVGVFDSRLGVIRVILKRNPIFYVYMMILPTFTINMIAIGGVFLKKSTQMEKLTIGFTHIMTMTFILGLVSEKIPKTSEIPLMGKYIVFGLGLMIFALIISSGFNRVFIMETNNRRNFAGRIVKLFFITTLQILNILSFSYMIYRFLKFEIEFGTNRNCDFENDERNFSKYSNMSQHFDTFEDELGDIRE
ncbi:unnamed protein product [Caenorhabditis angaria]|uniref:Neurotransmitter-gated ion-channel ligand-binding domain-containing protein n=1 Tax=Caenorhabditis angaria TaxID=860376 RepID=A0A9P1I4C7_9PELO|nr:unnamed protein product [Caenorhabditis angaria]